MRPRPFASAKPLGAGARQLAHHRFAAEAVFGFGPVGVELPLFEPFELGQGDLAADADQQAVEGPSGSACWDQ